MKIYTTPWRCTSPHASSRTLRTELHLDMITLYNWCVKPNDTFSRILQSGYKTLLPPHWLQWGYFYYGNWQMPQVMNFFSSKESFVKNLVACHCSFLQTPRAPHWLPVHGILFCLCAPPFSLPVESHLEPIFPKILLKCPISGSHSLRFTPSLCPLGWSTSVEQVA